MIKAVLLDLDNTLLQNPDRRFATALLPALEAHFQRRGGRGGAAAAYRRGIQVLGNASEGCATVLERLVACIAQDLEQAQAESESAFITFFASAGYDALQALTMPQAYAQALLTEVLQQGLLVALATNPIYPAAAIDRRLDWAGLGEFRDALAFITTAENVHAAKPSQAYFAETIARLSVEPDEALVIGDSQLNDIMPARALGLHAWHVNAETGLLPHLQTLQSPDWQQNLPDHVLDADTLPAQFRGNLAALRGLLLELRPSQWLQQPDPDEWSILQILCHLWQAESAVHQTRIRRILNEDNPFLRAATPPGPELPACHDDGWQVYRWFAEERERTMQLLDGLSASDWNKQARHSIFGMTTLLEMASFTAQHDRLHISQLCQTLGKCDD